MFPIFDRTSGPGVYFAHPYSSYALKPQVPLSRQRKHGEAEPNDKSNSLGFRGTMEYPAEHPGITRIIVTGGSSAYGIRNPISQSIPVLLENLLHALPGAPEVQVINAAMVSSTTAETIGRLRHPILDLKPDIVIIYDGFNDLVPRIYKNFRPDYAHYRLAPHSTFAPIFPLLNHSRLATYLARATLGEPSLRDYIENKVNLPDSLEQAHENFKKSGTAVFRANLEFLVRALQAYGVQVVLPTFAYCRSMKDFWITDFPDDLWEPGILENDRVIRELQGQFSLAPFDLYEKLLPHPELFSGQIHFNNNGNQFVAVELGKIIAPLLSHDLSGR